MTLRDRKAYDARRPERGTPKTPQALERRRERDRERSLDPARIASRKAADALRKGRSSPSSNDEDEGPMPIIGVDGEGEDTPDGGHIYTYLAAVDEFGSLIADAHNPAGLSHQECTDMLLSLPQHSLKFGFMFSYDVTKIIEEMPAADRYYLMRPDARQGKMCNACKETWTGDRKPWVQDCEACGGEKVCAACEGSGAVGASSPADDYDDCPACEGGCMCPACDGEGGVARTGKECPSCGSTSVQGFTRSLRWGGRTYGFFNGSLTIASGKRAKVKKKTKIWDCFRFFGCAFVEAIKDWGVASPAQLERIQHMKDKRGAFADESPADVKAYCKEECFLLAVMMRKLITAHEEAGIPLTSYYGAGSTAGALLKKNLVGEFKGPPLEHMPKDLAAAISCAFFGGRFENSQIGKITVPVQSYDISSAYPYALADLPCLKCGTWTLIQGNTPRDVARMKKATLALCKFRVGKLSAAERRELAWGPLPCRDAKGSICYGTNFTGWAWRPEVLAALRGWPDLVTLEGETWIYETVCDHKPFAFLPEVYRQRVQWGKEGAGKVLKLGANASYGKTAQTLGDDPPFQSWVWAGMTTGTCRGQLLDGICLAKDPWSVLALATDGIYGTEKLAMPKPRDTGTSDLPKPLGGWEHKEIPEGAFLAKPGLYFRLATTLADMRARGVGRREVFSQRERLMSAFEGWDRKDFSFYVPMTSRRFYGAKTSVIAQSRCAPCGKTWPGVPEKGCPKCGAVGSTFKVDFTRTPEEFFCAGCDKGFVGKPKCPLCGKIGKKTRESKVAYGTWNVREVRIKFDPHPKRERRLGRGGSSVRLTMRDLGGIASAPYRTGATTPEGQAAREGSELALEQPDWDGSAQGGL